MMFYFDVLNPRESAKEWAARTKTLLNAVRRWQRALRDGSPGFGGLYGGAWAAASDSVGHLWTKDARWQNFALDEPAIAEALVALDIALQEVGPFTSWETWDGVDFPWMAEVEARLEELTRALAGVAPAPTLLEGKMTEPKPVLVLGEPGERPQLDGVELDGLSADQRDVVQTLYEAGPRGLDMYELRDKSGVEYPVRILRELRVGRKGRRPRTDHAAWLRIILMSGDKHEGYRLGIAWPEEILTRDN